MDRKVYIFQLAHNKQTLKHLFLYLGIGQVCSLRALPQPEQELALEKHAISHSGSCGCAALRQKRPLLDASINVPLIHEKVILLIKESVLLFHFPIVPRYLDV